MGKQKIKSSNEIGDKNGIRPDKVELARQRLTAGFYNSAQVSQQVIRKLLQDPQFLKTL
jgi:hypothetical protein